MVSLKDGIDVVCRADDLVAAIRKTYPNHDDEGVKEVARAAVLLAIAATPSSPQGNSHD